MTVPLEIIMRMYYGICIVLQGKYTDVMWYNYGLMPKKVHKW